MVGRTTTTRRRLRSITAAASGKTGAIQPRKRRDPRLAAAIVLSLGISASSAVAATINYTSSTSNFTLTTQDNNANSFSGAFNSGANLGLYANSGDGTFGKNPQ